ncbi:hypothetical protein RISK_005234 [Rhodopirellula islandica]|uniref:Uncharacterized protein n=1 Tax=Rhodopirellula islandica TaxID=595434 RepID=A0A0J1B8T4_RHOIS|nr:hypothetical protein RISK_005234 [Rhodopirellula islandica]
MFAWLVDVVEQRDANVWERTWLRGGLAVEGSPTEQLRQLFYTGARSIGLETVGMVGIATARLLSRRECRA